MNHEIYCRYDDDDDDDDGDYDDDDDDQDDDDDDVDDDECHYVIFETSHPLYIYKYICIYAHIRALMRWYMYVSILS